MNLFIDPKLLNKVQEQNNPLLNVPGDAAPGRNRSFRWPELLTISQVHHADVEKGRVELVVKYRVSLASPNPQNRGKSTRSRYLINMAAPAGSGEETMTMISLGNVHALIRAACPDVDLSTGIDLEYFFAEGSPLLNRDVVVTLVDKPDKDDPNIRRQEITRFTAVE